MDSELRTAPSLLYWAISYIADVLLWGAKYNKLPVKETDADHDNLLLGFFLGQVLLVGHSIAPVKESTKCVMGVLGLECLCPCTRMLHMAC